MGHVSQDWFQFVTGYTKPISITAFDGSKMSGAECLGRIILPSLPQDECFMQIESRSIAVLPAQEGSGAFPNTVQSCGGCHI